MASISPLSSLSPLNTVSSISSKQSKPRNHHVSKPLTTSEEPKAPHIVGSCRRDVLIGLGVGGLCLNSNTNNSLAITFANAAETSSSKGTTVSSEFPITLDSVVSAVVERPKQSRSKKEKEEEEEVLVVDGIEFDRNQGVKFDVVINCDEDINQIGPKNAEFAGSFVSLPHTLKHGSKRINTCLRLGLTDLLQDLEAEDDHNVLVTLVPKYGRGLVTVKGIKIELQAD